MPVGSACSSGLLWRGLFRQVLIVRIEAVMWQIRPEGSRTPLLV